jgi:hypothetical protein
MPLPFAKVELVDVSWSLAALAIVDAVAIFSVAWAGVRLARRYRAIPARVPLRLRLDGRPQAVGPKSGLWAGPVVLAAITLGLTIAVVVRPPTEAQRPALIFAFLMCAECTWFVAWTIDRLIEIARGMTVRIAPQRIFGLAFPILATIAFAVVATLAESL